jgi:hypothetical protein
MNDETMSDLWRALSTSMTQPHTPPPSSGQTSSRTREERIANFNKEVDDLELAKSTSSAGNIASTFDFVRKSRSKVSAISTLRPIDITDLQAGATHKGRAVFCRIASRVYRMNSAMVLVEDDSGLTDLAIYGLSDGAQLTPGRRIAIVEPFFKIRSDGTPGIRVDDPADLVLDVEPPVAPEGMLEEEEITLERLSVEMRLQELMIADETMGAQRLHQTLVDEGYAISKKRVQALKKASGKESATLIPILSERRPEKHRVLRSSSVLAHREEGNTAFKSGKFAEAEEHYSAALQQKDDNEGKAVGEEGVALWQLYGNRCATRMRLGRLDDAMRDSLASNMCAPADEVKPLLRCAEALSALGLRKESTDLLEAAVVAFPGGKVTIDKKKQALAPKRILRVGDQHEFASIVAAVRVAPPGAEILVDSGVYPEPLYLTNPVTIRSNAVSSDYAAIDSLDGEDKSPWAEIRVDGINNSIFCGSPSTAPIHIIGFRIVCTEDPRLSLHAVRVVSGVVVLRNCSMTSSSGPVVCAEHHKTRVIMQTCAVHSGAQGGILICASAELSLQQVHCSRNAANGLELRGGGSAVIDGSHFYSNGRQGIIVWHGAGQLSAKRCAIHSNTQESGILVSEAAALLDSCQIYGNGAAGVVSQKKGSIRLVNCEVHDNCEGVLIQDTGSASVERCDVFSNRANGIFVGYDHCGTAAIVDNKVHDNVFKGILVGNTAQVVARGNVEHSNRGLPPIMPKIPAARTPAAPSRKFLKRVKKNKAGFTNTFVEPVPGSFLGHLVQEKVQAISDDMVRSMEKLEHSCGFCKAAPSGDEKFAVCSRCGALSYCSSKCQKAHWQQEHKVCCKPKSVKYPAFIDNQASV